MKILNWKALLLPAVALMAAVAPNIHAVNALPSSNDHVLETFNATNSRGPEIHSLERRNPVAIGAVASWFMDQFLGLAFGEAAGAFFGLFGGQPNIADLSEKSLKEIRNIVKSELDKLITKEYNNDAQDVSEASINYRRDDNYAVAVSAIDYIINRSRRVIIHFENLEQPAAGNRVWQAMVALHLTALAERMNLAHVRPLRPTKIKEFFTAIQDFAQVRFAALDRMIRTYEPSEVQYGFEKSKTSKTRRCCARGFCWDCGEMKYTGFARLFAGPNDAREFQADSFFCSSNSCVESTTERARQSARDKMNTFLATWRPERKDLVFGVDHHKLWALLDKTRQATFSIPWRCMRMKDWTVPAWTP
ncbi:hypothetical protein HDU67_001362, partial [Dinochytrium kinnereticum]